MPFTLLPEHGPFLNLTTGIIGRAVVTSQGNPSPGYTLLRELPAGGDLDAGHIVAIPTPDGHVTFAMTRESNVLSDLNLADVVDEGEDEPMTERPTARVWRVELIGNTAGTTRPVGAGPAYYPSALGVAVALGTDRIPNERRIPAGIFQNGDGMLHPVYLHADYLLGPQGVHADWSGVSGLAAKTSKKALLEHAILHMGPTMNLRVAVVVFAS
jgi:hypothetical protein